MNKNDKGKNDHNPKNHENEKKEEEEKKEAKVEQPNFNPSGILAKFTNSVK